MMNYAYFEREIWETKIEKIDKKLFAEISHALKYFLKFNKECIKIHRNIQIEYIYKYLNSK